MSNDYLSEFQNKSISEYSEDRTSRLLWWIPAIIFFLVTLGLGLGTIPALIGIVSEGSIVGAVFAGLIFGSLTYGFFKLTRICFRKTQPSQQEKNDTKEEIFFTLEHETFTSRMEAEEFGGNLDILKEDLQKRIEIINLPESLQWKKKELVEELSQFSEEEIEEQKQLLSGLYEEYKSIKGQQEIEKPILDKIVVSQLPKKLQEKVKVFNQTRDLEERRKLLSDIKEKIGAAAEYYIEKFVNSHGRGTSKQKENLKGLITHEVGYKLSMDELDLSITEKVKKREKLIMRKIIDSYKPASLDDKLEVFVKEFGSGTERSINCLAAVLDMKKSELTDLINDKVEDLREKQELRSFKQSLGLEKNDSEGHQFEDNLAEKEKEILAGLKEKGSEKKTLEYLDGYEFEELINRLFNSKGYSAETTKKSGDEGADVIAKKPSDTVVIQAKHLTSGKVSNSAIQEVVASKKPYHADRTLVITSSQFTRPAKRLAKANNVELWDRGKLLREANQYLRKGISWTIKDIKKNSA